MCTYCGFAFFQARTKPCQIALVFAYPPTDFTGLGGNVIVTNEAGQRIALVQLIAGHYVTSIFDPPWR